jgi:translation initiation factor 1
MDIEKELNDYFTNTLDDLGEKVHIRIQQRNGKKSISSVAGLPQDLDFKKILKTFKKSFKCNGCIIEEEKDGATQKIIQLQGDHRASIRDFLVSQEIVELRNIVIHGF